MSNTVHHSPDSRRGVQTIARSISAHHGRLDLEARSLDPSGRGQCDKRTCRACGAESYGRRGMFEEFRECHECGSTDTVIAETSYPRHTEETLRVHVAREFGDRGRFLFSAAQVYLRRYLRRCHAPRRMRREGARSRRRSHRPAVKAGDGDGDGDPPEPGRPRAPTRIGGAP